MGVFFASAFVPVILLWTEYGLSGWSPPESPSVQAAQGCFYSETLPNTSPHRSGGHLFVKLRQLIDNHGKLPPVDSLIADGQPTPHGRAFGCGSDSRRTIAPRRTEPPFFGDSPVPLVGRQEVSRGRGGTGLTRRSATGSPGKAPGAARSPQVAGGGRPPPPPSAAGPARSPFAAIP